MTARVILIAGQSNAAGYGDTSGLAGAMAASGAGVQIWVDGEANAPVIGAWRPVDAICGGSIGGHNHIGVETSLATYLQGLRPGEDWRIIKYAISSTSIVADWNSGGATYAAWLATVRAALAALGTDYTIDGMAWLQGESDALIDLATANAYQANLTALIAAMRAELATPSMPWVLSRILLAWGAWSAQVRACQAATVAAVARTAMIDTDDLPQGGGHYDTRGIWALGLRFGAALAGLIP